MEVKRSAPPTTRPWIEKNTVYVSRSISFSHIYIDTENLIVADFFISSDEALEWYFFLDDTRVGWSELEDSQKLLIRVCAKQYWGNGEYKHGLGKYEDDRYYALEALSEN